MLVLSGTIDILANSKESVPRQRKNDRSSLANLILPVWNRYRLSLDLHTVEILETLKVLLAIRQLVFWSFK